MVETQRPKIILIHGQHPNESAVTFTLAKLLYPLLTARGFDVIIEEFPKQDTITELFMTNQYNTPEEIYADLIRRENEFYNKLRRLHNTNNLITLHTTPSTNYELRTLFKPIKEKSPKLWKAREVNLGIPNELTLSQDRETGVTILEMPAIYNFPLSDRHIPEVMDRFNKLKFTDAYSKLVHRNILRYFLEHSNLERTIKAGYLGNTVVTKFAHLIDTTIKTRLGIYSAPRRMPFKSKTDKETSIQKEIKKKPELRDKLLLLLRKRMRPR
jgi:hypothetical protein